MSRKGGAPLTDTSRELHTEVHPEEHLSFTLDGRPTTAMKGELLIAAAERAGTYIPRFCYHPRMAPVGMCRMCLVDVEGPRGATLTPSCAFLTRSFVVSTTMPSPASMKQAGCSVAPRGPSTSTRHMRHMPTGSMRGW